MDGRSRGRNCLKNGLKSKANVLTPAETRPKLLKNNNNKKKNKYSNQAALAKISSSYLD